MAGTTEVILEFTEEAFDDLGGEPLSSLFDGFDLDPRFNLFDLQLLEKLLPFAKEAHATLENKSERCPVPLLRYLKLTTNRELGDEDLSEIVDAGDGLILSAELAPNLAPSCAVHGYDEWLGKDQHPEKIQKYGGYKQWYHYATQAVSAWKKATGKGITVANLDWGFDLDHIELKDDMGTLAVTHYESFLGLPPNRVDYGTLSSHGNGTLGFIGARRNSKRIQGTAFDSDLWALQCGSSRHRKPDGFIKGLEHILRKRLPALQAKTARTDTVCVFEAQLDSGECIEQSKLLRDVIALTVLCGVTVVVPAGNGGKKLPLGGSGVPCDSGSVVVGATAYSEHGQQRWVGVRDASNYGSRVNIFAPGDPRYDLTISSKGQKKMQPMGGTSSAAAKVAGGAALVQELYSGDTTERIRERLCAGGDTINVPMDKNKLINLDAAT